MKQKFICISIFLFTLIHCTRAQPAGDGTTVHPYEIATAGDLRWLSENPDFWLDHFIQTADIDLSESRNWNYGQGFSPIGSDLQGFQGTYNGKGHTINGLYINRTGKSRVGLFGSLYKASIDSLGIINCKVAGYSETGGLAGCNYGQCFISHCYVEGDIKGTYDVGGVVGFNLSGSHLIICFFSGNVNGRASLGGLAGSNSESSSIIDCYSTGNVTGEWNLGGLAGWNSDTSAIKNCYASGRVTASSHEHIGGLAGANMHAVLDNCFWNPVTTGQTMATGNMEEGTVSNCTGLRTGQMKQKESFTGWDFTDIWGMAGNRSYPALRAVNNNAPFVFADTVSRYAPKICMVSLLSNDIDFETGNRPLVGKFLSTSAGSVRKDTLFLPVSAATGDTLILNYRAGNVLAGGDTLWGNSAASLLVIGNIIPELKEVTCISIEEDTELFLTVNDIIASDPDGQALSVIAGDGMNFTRSGGMILPDKDFNGLLFVNIAVSDGMDTSNIMTMQVNVLAVNDAPVARDTILAISENTVMAVNVNAHDVDGTVTSVSIDRDPENGTAKHKEMTITYTPRKDFTGQDTLTWYAVDDKGLTSESATLVITVVAAIPSPVADLADQGIMLYPNPCRDAFYIQAGDMPVQVYVYDLNGKVVLTQKAQELTHVDVSHLADGTYIVKINGTNLRLIKTGENGK